MAAQPQTAQLPSTFAFPRKWFGVVAGLVGTAAIVTMVVYAWRLVTAAPVTPKLLVPSGRHGIPGWMAGMFRGLGTRIGTHELIRLVIVLSVLYVFVLAFSRWIPGWVAIAGSAVLILLFTVAPPMFSTDIFNYVAYARMGTLYH